MNSEVKYVLWWLRRHHKWGGDYTKVNRLKHLMNKKFIKELKKTGLFLFFKNDHVFSLNTGKKKEIEQIVKEYMQEIQKMEENEE